MNKLPKSLCYFVAIRMDKYWLKYLFSVNKYWYRIGQDNYFWQLKIKYDFPELHLPYKYSNFRGIYWSECQRLRLLDKFIFVLKLPNPGFNEDLNEGQFSDLLRLSDNIFNSKEGLRITSILSGIVNCNIYNNKIIYGYYDGYRFSIEVGKYAIYYGFEWSFYMHNPLKHPTEFGEDLSKLINLSLPKFSDEWNICDEYFNQYENLLNPYVSFISQPTTKIILYKDNNLDDIWNKFLQKVHKNSKKIIGKYYGRIFYIIYDGSSEIYLLVEPLMDNTLINELKNILLIK